MELHGLCVVFFLHGTPMSQAACESPAILLTPSPSQSMYFSSFIKQIQDRDAELMRRDTSRTLPRPSEMKRTHNEKANSRDGHSMAQLSTSSEQERLDQVREYLTVGKPQTN